jgi:hypothetical protein
MGVNVALRDACAGTAIRNGASGSNVPCALAVVGVDGVAELPLALVVGQRLVAVAELPHPLVVGPRLLAFLEAALAGLLRSCRTIMLQSLRSLRWFV